MKDLQEKFLSRLRDEQRPVVVFVSNGFQVRGIITDFDQFTIQMTVDSKENLLYKSNLTTVREA